MNHHVQYNIHTQSHHYARRKLPIAHRRGTPRQSISHFAKQAFQKVVGLRASTRKGPVLSVDEDGQLVNRSRGPPLPPTKMHNLSI